jgi:hypothetical protein
MGGVPASNRGGSILLEMAAGRAGEFQMQKNAQTTETSSAARRVSDFQDIEFTSPLSGGDSR